MNNVDKQAKELDKLAQATAHLKRLQVRLKYYYSEVESGELALKPRIENIKYDDEYGLLFWVYLYALDQNGMCIFAAHKIYLGDETIALTTDKVTHDLNSEFDKKLNDYNKVIENLPNGLGGTE